MPTYDYKCDACGHTFERFQSITARSIRTCPECKERRVRRLLGTGAGFLFRGSGFYETDYRSEQYKKEAKADRERSEKKESKSSGEGGAKLEEPRSDGTSKSST